MVYFASSEDIGRWLRIVLHIMMCLGRGYDGFSIGSNDLTQLTLGLDRDSGLELLAKDFDERDPAVKAMLAMSIKACLDQGKYVGICGQGPSDHPDFAKWLVGQGITSISLNPDSVVETWKLLAAEASLFVHHVRCDGSNGRDQWLLSAPSPRQTWFHAIEFPIRLNSRGFFT
jgi:signal transduction protein with GAF and PtsI domain